MLDWIDLGKKNKKSLRLLLNIFLAQERPLSPPSMLCNSIEGAESLCASFMFVAQGCWNTDCNRNGRKKVRILLLLHQEIYQYYICQKQCNQFYLSHKLVYLIWQTLWFSSWSKQVWPYFNRIWQLVNQWYGLLNNI